MLFDIWFQSHCEVCMYRSLRVRLGSIIRTLLKTPYRPIQETETTKQTLFVYLLLCTINMTSLLEHSDAHQIQYYTFLLKSFMYLFSQTKILVGLQYSSHCKSNKKRVLLDQLFYLRSILYSFRCATLCSKSGVILVYSTLYVLLEFVLELSALYLFLHSQLLASF